jgi:tetratricopeptide (TPR) repeat protein
LGEDAHDPYQFAAMLQWVGRIHLVRGELAEAEDLFRRSVDLCTEIGFSSYRWGSTFYMGLVSVLRGQTSAGLELLRRGLQLQPPGSVYGQEPQAFGYFQALGLASAGRPDEAFSTLIRALEWAEQVGMKFDQASMHLLKGRLFEGKSNSREAENSFRTSIEIARRQSAKSLELRATTSLARLLAKQDRRDEARAMLAEIYGWFTEGFDTADLKEAKALLDELKA